MSVFEILYGYRFTMYVNDNNLLRKNKRILTKELCLAGWTTHDEYMGAVVIWGYQGSFLFILKILHWVTKQMK